jgi:hypothetical protein
MCLVVVDTCDNTVLVLTVVSLSLLCAPDNIAALKDLRAPRALPGMISLISHDPFI